MYQAIEAVCRNGTIKPLEPIVFDEDEHLLIVRLPRGPLGPQSTGTPGASVRGSMRGMLSSVDAFIAAKQDEIDREERG